MPIREAAAQPGIGQGHGAVRGGRERLNDQPGFLQSKLRDSPARRELAAAGISGRSSPRTLLSCRYYELHPN
jgi:hypothetical protein